MTNVPSLAIFPFPSPGIRQFGCGLQRGFVLKRLTTGFAESSNGITPLICGAVHECPGTSEWGSAFDLPRHDGSPDTASVQVGQAGTVRDAGGRCRAGPRTAILPSPHSPSPGDVAGATPVRPHSISAKETFP